MAIDLLKEATDISLPCFDLVPAAKGDRVVAHWGGKRSDLPERFPPGMGGAYKGQRHFLSVDQGLFTELGLSGRGPLVLSMATTVEDDERLGSVSGSTGNLSEISFEESISLTAKPAVSLPPLQALALYGGPAVEDWLSSLGLERWEYTGMGSDAAEEYARHFESQTMLLMAEPPFARIGGWHIQWPEDNFYMPREMRLMVWTFQDAEPWYEVFLSPQRNYVIKERNT
jgi:hypothetical protein